MTETVNDIVIARSRRQESFTPTLLASLMAHAVAVAMLLFLPSVRPADEPEENVFKVSLGGAPGPKTGGLNQIGGQAVQEVAPPQPAKREETAPAPVQPKMTLPNPKPRPKPTKEKAPDDAAGKKPVTGERVEEGNAPVQTQARGVGFGLSSTGGLGGQLELDVREFCCPKYLEMIVKEIERNWHPDQGRPGMKTVVRFTIRRDGTVDSVMVDRPSGVPDLDLSARRAVQLATLERLPGEFPNPTLTVRMTFVY
ncbi:MAG TPA: TonB family protein [Vicinamibacterales bacterium]|nr:TonB family protein [Vicinamibacterales bacterium]